MNRSGGLQRDQNRPDRRKGELSRSSNVKQERPKTAKDSWRSQRTIIENTASPQIRASKRRWMRVLCGGVGGRAGQASKRGEAEQREKQRRREREVKGTEERAEDRRLGSKSIVYPGLAETRPGKLQRRSGGKKKKKRQVPGMPIKRLD